MFRFCFLIVISFFLTVYYDLKAKYVIEHIDKYDNEYRYNLVKGRIEEQMAVLDENRIKNGYNRWKYK